MAVLTVKVASWQEAYWLFLRAKWVSVSTKSHLSQWIGSLTIKAISPIASINPETLIKKAVLTYQHCL